MRGNCTPRAHDDSRLPFSYESNDNIIACSGLTTHDFVIGLEVMHKELVSMLLKLVVDLMH